MVSLWDHFGTISYGINLGSFLVPFWDHFWDNFGIIFGSSWDHLGLILGATTGEMQPRRPRLHGEFVISKAP